MLYAIIILACALPIMTISAFVIGYNVNATKKILVKAKKQAKTEDEMLLEKIDQLKPEDF